MATDWPYYMDDPLVDRTTHRFLLEPLDLHGPGRALARFRSACSCGNWSEPSAWDRHAHQEVFDQHMRRVQADVHQAAERLTPGQLELLALIAASAVATVHGDLGDVSVRIVKLVLPPNHEQRDHGNKAGSGDVTERARRLALERWATGPDNQTVQRGTSRLWTLTALGLAVLQSRAECNPSDRSPPAH